MVFTDSKTKQICGDHIVVIAIDFIYFYYLIALYNMTAWFVKTRLIIHDSKLVCFFFVINTSI